MKHTVSYILGEIINYLSCKETAYHKNEDIWRKSNDFIIRNPRAYKVNLKKKDILGSSVSGFSPELEVLIYIISR